MRGSKLIKWKNFRNHISETCKLNYAWDRFTDMTFIVQKRRITAHKIILSANSEFFRMILSENPHCAHPTISLPDINYEDLDAIMKFIYTGELLVHPERLESVLSLASCFQVKSLMKVQAALIKESYATGNANERTDVPDVLASTSQHQVKLATSGVSPSTSHQVKLAAADIVPSTSQQQVKLVSSDVLPSTSQSQPKVVASDVLPSTSQSQPKVGPKHKKQALQSQKAQKNKKPKEHMKNLAESEKSGQTSNGAATGEPEKKKGRKSCVSRNDILILGGKQNGRALTPKAGVAPRSSYRCIKEKLLKEFEKGGTLKEVCKLFNMSPSCAFYYKKCFVKAGKLSPSMINWQKRLLDKNTKSKKVAEKLQQNLQLQAEVGKGPRKKVTKVSSVA